MREEHHSNPIGPPILLSPTLPFFIVNLFLLLDLCFSFRKVDTTVNSIGHLGTRLPALRELRFVNSAIFSIRCDYDYICMYYTHAHADRHTHTHIYIYVYSYIYACLPLLPLSHNHIALIYVYFPGFWFEHQTCSIFFSLEFIRTLYVVQFSSSHSFSK